MNLYDENLSAVKKYNSRLWNALTTLTEEKYRTEPARSGLLTLIHRQENQDFYIHSKFKPEDEAFKLIQNPKLNLAADHIIVLGLGLGYHLEILLHSKPPHTRVLLVEPELEIVKHSLKTLNWTKLFTRNDFFFCFGSDMNALSAAVREFIDMPVFNSLEFIELPSEARFLDEYFNEAHHIIDNEIKTILYDFQTLLSENAMVPRNILKNIHGILQTRPVKALKNRFPGKPGFIVSAGPSLDKNVLQLKKIKNRGVIICVDTALKPLLKRGIHPHFTITADPSYKNYLHLQGAEKEIKYFLVSDTGISTQVYEDFKEHLFSVSLGKPILKMIEQNIGEIGELEAWGSVISLALTFAIYIGLNPIVFLGQDFAFTGMRNHCRGTSWEDTWLENGKNLDYMQRTERDSIAGISKVMEVPDIYGYATMTSDKLTLYKNYMIKTFPSYPEKRFINATEGGIFKEIEIKDLRRVIEEFVYNLDPIDFGDLFKIPTMYNPENKKKLITFFKAKSDFFKKYRKKLNESVERLEKLGQAGNLPLASVYPVLEEAQQLKELLYANVRNGEIVEMWSQGPIFEFLKRYRKLETQGISEATFMDWVKLFQNYFERLLPNVSGIIDSFEVAIRGFRIDVE